MSNIVAIVTVSDNCIREPKTMTCQKILATMGWTVELEVEQMWTGFMRKVHFAKECAAQLTQYKYIMLVDARDVVVLEPPEVILERFLEFKHPWVFNGEPHIWPHNMYSPEDYPPCDGPYRYLNSGAFIAEREYVLECFNRWDMRGPRDVRDLVAKGEDGPFYSGYYVHEPGVFKLDSRCTLFQCMCGSDAMCEVTSGDVYNRITDTHPRIIHYNGGTDITMPDRRILWEQMLTS